MNTYLILSILNTAFEQLPAIMDSTPAWKLLLAIGYQESRFKHRRQIRGPARGYWQFEENGVGGVLRHPATRQHALEVCEALNYPNEVTSVYPALADNDILAAAFARLNLWWVPSALPEDKNSAWEYYLFAWRPGKPHRSSWDAAWAFAEEALP